MNSYEQSKQAVELYITYDKSAGAVLSDLGYPTPKMLKTWHREYQQHGRLHVKTSRG